MKLWDKGGMNSKKIHAFTVGNDREIDVRIARYDVQASLAHVRMLASVNLLTSEDLALLEEGLARLEDEVNAKTFLIPSAFEDIHSYIEYKLTKWYGETGKKVHTARSRNDQVLVAFHLFIKEELKGLKEKTRSLAVCLCDLAELHASDFIPGYTHMQVAMPSSIGMWLSAYAECLADDLRQLVVALYVADQNPLGTAAGYGSNFPINRELTTELLGLANLKVNPMAAQLNRGKLESTATFACAQVGTTIGKLANDCVVFLSQNYGFISFPDDVTTGSSIMPHKKNPDVFELVRAKSGVLNSIPVEVMALTRNLSAGYHRDFQLLKDPVIRSVDTLNVCLDILLFMLPQLSYVKVDLSEARYAGIFSVDAVAKLVQEGASFREAYQEVGIYPKNYQNQKEPLPTSHIGSLHNLSIERIRKKLS